MRTHRRTLVSLIVLGGVAALGACDGGRGTTQPVASADAFVSTSFDACVNAGDANPSPVSVSGAAFARTMHGVWVGRRTVRNGRSLLPQLRKGREPLSHYLMIYDMKTAKAIAFEESGPEIRENAFNRLLPAARPGAPGMSYLHCAAQFRDDFVKVSDDPGQGLAALAQVTGTPLAGKSVAAAWNALQAAGVFTRERENVLTVGAFYDLSTQAVQGGTPQVQGLRLVMAGRYSGTAAEFSHDQAEEAVEGGVLEGVSTQSGEYYVGVDANSTPGAACPVDESGQPACPDSSVVVEPMPEGETERLSSTYRLVIGPIVDQ